MRSSLQTSDPTTRMPYFLALATLLLLIFAAVVGLTTGQPAGPTQAVGAPEAATSDPLAPTVAPATQPAKPAIIRAEDSPLADLQLSLMLDPRLTRGLYMGDRWVSPPAYTRVGDREGCRVEIKVQGIDTYGKPVTVTPQWTVDDPGMVAVSVGSGHAFNLTVHHAGQTAVEVSALGFTKQLAVNATEQDGVLTMQLSQPPNPALQAAQAAAVSPAAGSWSSGLDKPPGQTARPRQHRRGQQVPIPDELKDTVAQQQAAQQQLGGSMSTPP